MKKNILFTIIIIASFFVGYGFKSYIVTKNNTLLKRVTSLGGIFFKANNPALLRNWYQTHLGINTNEYGCVFEWYQGADSTQKGFTQWSPFKSNTNYFQPSNKDFMINYRVENLSFLVDELKKEGVTILDTIETYDYGKFVHIIDIENNKIELWEPNDKAYEKMGIDMGAKTTK